MEIICPSCDFTRSIPDGKIPPGAKWVRCPQCKNRFDFTLGNLANGHNEKTGDSPINDLPLRQASPWENRMELGTWQGIFNSLKSVLFSPKSFFSNLAFDLGIIEPLAFGLLVGSIGGMLGSFREFLFRSDQFAAIAGFLPVNIDLNILFLYIIILIPFLNVIWISLAGIIIHICLLLTGGGGNGFEGTFRVIAFSQSTQILGVIPYLGAVIAFIWSVVILLIGCKEIHETTFIRVIGALFIPIILFTILVVALVSLISVLAM